MSESIKRKIEYGLIICAFILICVVLVRNFHNFDSFTKTGLTDLDQGWYYMKDDKKVYVNLPVSLEMKNSEQLILYNDYNLGDRDDLVLVTKGAQYDVQVSLDGEKLYAFEDSSFPKNEQMKRKLECDVSLPKNAGGKTISLIYNRNDHKTFEIEFVKIGSSDAVFLYQLNKASIMFIIARVMGILAIIAFCIAVYLKYRKMSDRRFFDVALFLVISEIWCITDSSFIQNMCKNSPEIGYVSFYAFMLLAVPMIHFVKNTGRMNRYRMIDVVIGAFYVNVIVQTLISVAGMAQFTQMLWVTHVLLIFGIVILVYYMFKEYKNKKEKSILIILISFIALAASGILALFLYWAFEYSKYEIIFEIGIVCFVIINILGMLETMVEGLIYKTEVKMYHKIAREDRLTGLKNRRAYDEYMGDFEHMGSELNDATLIFMDLNRLKSVNDVYGHAAGDQFIISAAKAIQKAFGDIGECFRIGGDEFCTIIADSKHSKSELSKMLDKEIDAVNRNNPYNVSIARGISFYIDENGNKKSVDQWFRDADKKMYKDKKENR